MQVQKGTLVLIKKIVLETDQRATHIPDDTKKVPLTMWIKGVLTQDAKLNDIVTIKTETHRFETGELIEVKPYYKHNFGQFVDAIEDIKQIIKIDTEAL